MSEKSFLSASWYRVAGLKPRLRAHARFHRTLFRGQVWYVLQDRTSGRFHRFSPAAYLLVKGVNIQDMFLLYILAAGYYTCCWYLDIYDRCW